MESLMRRASRLAGSLVVLSMIGAISTPVLPQAPVADAPTLNIGDQWRWTNGGSRRVTAVEGNLIVTPFSNQRCTQCRAYRDKNLTIVKVLDKEGNVVNDPEVGYKMLDFPLKVGKQWNSDHTLVNNTTGVSEQYKNGFSVEVYERVKTKAGTFTAFRITHVQQRAAHSSHGPDAGRSWRETLWYSPEVGAVVKREVNTARVNWGPDWELESYSLKSNVAAAVAPKSTPAEARQGAAPTATSPAPPAVGAATPQTPSTSSPATRPDLSKLEPGLSQSPVSVIMWSVDIEVPGPEVPPNKARWSGKWTGWACRNQACEAKLIVEKVKPDGAAIIYGFASAQVKPVSVRLDAKFVGEDLEASFRDGSKVSYHMRPEGDLEVYYAKGSYWYGGVLSKDK